MTTKAQRQLRLNDLADQIERVDRQFRYDHWCAVIPSRRKDPTKTGMLVRDLVDNIHLREGDCNTVGCVAGWGAVMGIEAGYLPRYYMDMPVSQYAALYLGLKAWEIDPIFLGSAMIDAGLYPETMDTSQVRRKATPVEVAKMLRMVAEGEVRIS